MEKRSIEKGEGGGSEWVGIDGHKTSAHQTAHVTLFFLSPRLFLYFKEREREKNGSSR